MRIYDGTPRPDYESVLRSIGAMLDQRWMREITIAETDDGFLVQGLVLSVGEERAWNDPEARLDKETFYLREDDVSRFKDESVTRRQGRAPQSAALPRQAQGFYEQALRVIGGYMDQQRPRDVFFFEQDHQFVIRLLMSTRAGLRHVIVEFTSDEIDSMVKSAHHRRS